MIKARYTKKHKRLGRGRFWCPKCRSKQAYIHKEAVRSGRVSFLPSVGLGSTEFVECRRCGTQFKTDVLKVVASEKDSDVAVRAIVGGAKIVAVAWARNQRRRR